MKDTPTKGADVLAFPAPLRMLPQLEFRITNWSAWDDQLFDAAGHFQTRFGDFPNRGFASTKTFQRITLVADRSRMRNGAGEHPGAHDYGQVGTFSTSEFAIELEVDENIEEGVVRLFDDPCFTPPDEEESDDSV